MSRTEIRTPARSEVKENRDVDMESLLSSLETLEENKYFYDMKKIPSGMTYEWKRHSLMGKEDPQYEAQLKRFYWRPVPANRHPECGCGDGEGPIIIGGQMLMERQQQVTNKIKEITDKKSNDLVNGQFQRLEISSNQHMPRKVTVNSRSYLPDSIPQ